MQLQHGRHPVAGVPGCVLAPVPPRRGRRRLIAAINVLTDFGNPIMIGGDLALLPTEAYMQINGWYDMSTASVLAVALLIPAVALFLVNRFWVAGGPMLPLPARRFR